MIRTQPSQKEARESQTAMGHLPSPRLVDTPKAFADMLAASTGEPVLALDTESDSLYRYFYRVCLIQISTSSADYLLDPLRLPDLRPLGTILADPNIEKVFHAAENDILVLKRDFQFDFANIFDTMLAARILGWPQVGLAALLAKHFGVQLDKRAQLTDWGRRPLTDTQLSYARLDSHYLFPLRALLKDALQVRRRWREAQEVFAALPDVTYVEKPFDPAGFWRAQGARDLKPAELAILRELYLWRDARARAMDRPSFKVLGDRMLIRLSQEQPHRTGDLPLNKRQASLLGSDILAAIARGRAAPAPQYPTRHNNDNHRPDPATISRYDKLRAWRTQRAAERGVESDVVLTNDILMTIAQTVPANLKELADLGVMGPWKLTEYGPDVLRVLRVDDETAPAEK